MNEEIELAGIIVGEKLGRGIHRDVFVFAPDTSKVIKIANSDEGRSVNLLENKIWDNILHTPLEKWFAQVFLVSSAGKYLIQQRVEQIPKVQYPKKIPHFFTDTKYSNFGFLKGKFVCVDFGSFNMFRGITTKMVKVDWWE